MSNIYTDLETIPGQDPAIEEAIRADIAEECEALKHPGSYKKKETIDAWYDAERDKLIASFDDRMLKCSLDGGRGEICSISFAVGDQPIVGDIRADRETESDLIQWFWDALVRKIESRPDAGYGEHVWIGHNIRSFDLPFLYKRCVILGIKPPFDVPFASGPSDRRVYDTMTEWAGWGKMISQDNLCRALGLPPKDIMKGSDVYQYWRDGRYDEILDYNKADVSTVRDIHRRMTFA